MPKQIINRRALFTAALALVAVPAVFAQTAPAPTPTPQIDLDRLKRPGPTAAPSDLFGSRSWEPRVREQKKAPPPPPPPQAPPVPFAYVGRWIEQGETTVVLSKERQHYILHAGDKVDGTYLLETVENDKLIIRYLPLNIAQVLPFSGAPPVVVPRPTQPGADDRPRPRPSPQRDPDDEDD